MFFFSFGAPLTVTQKQKKKTNERFKSKKESDEIIMDTPQTTASLV